MLFRHRLSTDLIDLELHVREGDAGRIGLLGQCPVAGLGGEHAWVGKKIVNIKFKTFKIV